MFSENGKISEKQMHRMLMLVIFAGTIFILPHLSASLFGASSMAGLLLFFCCGFIYIAALYGAGYLGKLSKEEREPAKGEGKTGYKIASGGLTILQFIRQIIHVTFFIVLSIKILGEAEVPFMRGSGTDNLWNILVVLPLILVAFYGANRSLEKVGRLYEMIFWGIFIPFIIMILFGLKEVDYGVFLPKWDMPFWKMLLYAYGLLAFVVPGEQFLYLQENLANNQEYTKKRISSCLYMIGTLALSIILSLFIQGIYGVNGASLEPMVTVDIMRYIRLPLGVLERFDVLMVWFFMLGCFVLICSSLFYGGQLVTKLSIGKRVWWLLGMIGISLVLVIWLPNYEDSLWLYFCYGAIVDVPLSLMIPILESLVE